MTKDTMRDPAIDLIRVVALFCVVIVHTHTGNFESNTLTGILELIFFCVGKLGVPLFVMISGALLLNNDHSHSTFYKRRLRKIAFPWFVWATLLLIYKISTGLVIVHSLVAIIKEYFIVLLSDFWFIPMIIGVYVLTPYIRSVLSSKLPLKPLLLVWFIITSIAPSVNLSPLFPGSSSAGLFTLVWSFVGYFVLGWYLKKNITKASPHLLLVLIAISFLIYVLGFTIFQERTNSLFFVLHDYFSPAIVISSSASFLLLLQQARKFLQFVPSTILTILSGSSYGIFLSHTLVLSAVSPMLLFFESENNLLLWIIRAVLIYSISALVVILLTKSTTLKRIFT